MTDFGFSPNPNRAAEIAWQPWGAGALQDAARADRLIFLHLTAVWCHWCHEMDETTLSDERVLALLRTEFVTVRVDADRHPHVQDRYIAGGWPTNAILTPTGEVLWSDTYVTADDLLGIAASVLKAWRERREELELEIGRRRSALEAARGQRAAAGLVRREPMDAVATLLRDSFDARNGGFGDAPKFPASECVELLYSMTGDDPTWARMADQTLDGMLAGELWDARDGGFFRYATAADWTAPRHEKLLEVNAGMLESYALGARLRDRDDWRVIAQRTVEWVDATLLRRDGLYGGSQCADAAYFAGEPHRAPPPTDTTIYTAANARWIGALAAAGARLEQDAWITRAADALTTLLATMSAPGGGLYHFCQDGGKPQLDFLLADLLETARAALTLAQATGAATWVAEARRLTRCIESAFWADDGGFWDRTRSDHDVGALRYRERPFELNALAARLLLDIGSLTGERSHRALAESTLSRLGAHAVRYGTSAAIYALATAEFFEQPATVFIAVPESGADGAALRRTALRMAVPARRVWTVASGHAVGPQRFHAQDHLPAAFICTARGCSAPIVDPDLLGKIAAQPV